MLYTFANVEQEWYNLTIFSDDCVGFEEYLQRWFMPMYDQNLQFLGYAKKLIGE